jgi:cobalamin biosynthesis protein CobD/CbiB
MEKKHPAYHPWMVHLTAIYRPDRDERIARAYELVLPIVSRSTRQSQEAENTNEAVPPHRHLRTRL